MTTKDILVKAQKLIEQGWCQGEFARDENDESVSPYSEKACSWCASGAIKTAIISYHHTSPNPYHLLKEIISNKPIEYSTIIFNDSDAIAAFNDHPKTTQNDILELFDKAIARCDNDD